MRDCSLPWFLVALSLVTGCGKSDPQTVTVDGQVSFDGQLMPAGDVFFMATTPDDKSYAGKIVDGRFSFAASPGPKRVEITAYRDVPGKFNEDNPGEKAPVREQYVPAAYNTATRLQQEVTASGPNRFEFSLDSTGK